MFQSGGRPGDVAPANMSHRQSLGTAPHQGIGTAIAHHGEILQGVFVGSDGHLHRGLVTLPCRQLRSEVTFVAARHQSVTVEPSWKHKARAAAEIVLQESGLAHWGGHLKIESAIPPCLGLGSSTSDVTGAIRAVAQAFNLHLTAERVARLAIRAEAAADSIMFEHNAVLFGHREGIVIEAFAKPLPPLTVLGFDTDPSGQGVDTVLLPPARYSWQEIEAFRPLLGLLRRAITLQEARLVGQVALASARINQRHLPKPCFDEIQRLMETAGAVGVQVAHSGSAVGILFDPDDDDVQSKIQFARTRVSEMGFERIWQF